MPLPHYKIDLFAIFIFLGIVQAIFLSVFFFVRENRNSLVNLFSGLLLISLAACSLEILLMYTGYIIHCLYLVDFSEPIAFVIGPLMYGILLATINKNSLSKYFYLHFIFPVVYLVLVIPFFLLPEEAKYNAWITSFNLDLPYKHYDSSGSTRNFWITDHHTLLSLISFVTYSCLTLYEVVICIRKKSDSLFKPIDPFLKKLHSTTLQVLMATLFILIVKLLNPLDTGDHYFAAYLSLIIYVVSFKVIRTSGFFTPPSVEPRYRNSAVPAQHLNEVASKIQNVLQTEKLFLQSDFSLPDLAKKVGQSVHVVSQAINSVLNKNFFELIGEYRIAEAKKILVEHNNLKVEEIAERVGYNSKSSFNNAFKKITGLTPSQFRDSSITNNSLKSSP